MYGPEMSKDLSDAVSVMRQLLAAFEHFNEIHPTRR